MKTSEINDRINELLLRKEEMVYCVFDKKIKDKDMFILKAIQIDGRILELKRIKRRKKND